MFDHSLVRYRFGILVNEPETSREFWIKYDEKEYLTDLENIRTFGTRAVYLVSHLPV